MVDEVLSVSVVAQRLENLISNVNNIRIKGEVADIRRSKANTIYFTLKDEKNIINCSVDYNIRRKFESEIISGNKIIVTADATYYKPNSNINFKVKYFEFVDEKGQYLIELERRKKYYQEKGYFDEKRKKTKPRLVKRIGVVTSANGAVIGDIKNVAFNRDPNLEIYVYSANVQTIGIAPKEISEGIRYFNENNNRYNLDAIIIGRGGGSEDNLKVFSDDLVVEAIYNSNILVVSAVGHNRDICLSDLVADLTAYTPSNAAEILVSVQSEEINKLNNYKKIINKNIQNRLRFNKEKMKSYKLAISTKALFKDVELKKQNLINIKRNLIYNIKNLTKNYNYNFEKLINRFNIKLISDKVEKYRYNINENDKKIKSMINKLLNDEKIKLENLSLKLSKHSSEDILKKGYSLTRYKGKIITDISQVTKGDKIETEVYNGKIVSKVE